MSGTAPATTPYSATGAASPRTGPHPVTMTRRATAVIGNVIGLRVENLYLANNMILSGQKSSDSATPATKTAPARATPPVAATTRSARQLGQRQQDCHVSRSQRHHPSCELVPDQQAELVGEHAVARNRS
jgi:hypothetical protein